MHNHLMLSERLELSEMECSEKADFFVPLRGWNAIGASHIRMPYFWEKKSNASTVIVYDRLHTP